MSCVGHTARTIRGATSKTNAMDMVLIHTPTVDATQETTRTIVPMEKEVFKPLMRVLCSVDDGNLESKCRSDRHAFCFTATLL